MRKGDQVGNRFVTEILSHTKQMSRVLLIAPAEGYRTREFVRAAVRLGVDLTIAGDAELPGDPDVLTLPLSDPETAVEQIVASDETKSVDAIVAVDDRGVEIAARASECLGLVHAATRAVAPTVDKAELRRRLDVPQPDWRLLAPADDAGEKGEELGWPIVLKPRGLSASRGVIRADTPDEARSAHARIRRILADACKDPDEGILAESFVPGVEVAVEGLARRGGMDVLAVFDKPDQPDGPYFEESIYVTPSRLPDTLRAAVVSTVEQAAGGLGLDSGAIHAEVRVTPEGRPVLIEIAARSIGGVCSRSLRFGLSTSLEELILRQALSLPGTSSRTRSASGVLMIPIPRAGMFLEVAGRDDVLSMAGVEEVEITVPPGSQVRPVPESDRYLGFVFARAKDPDAVELVLRAARDRLEVVVQ
ncbi:MAG: ATP-grasp domain-containing protein [Actinobacteria bacterium ATB1]|nr:ATP-grasp domain-containing protein [Actinobacteria bacterium ATB1]